MTYQEQQNDYYDSIDPRYEVTDNTKDECYECGCFSHETVLTRDERVLCEECFALAPNREINL